MNNQKPSYQAGIQCFFSGQWSLHFDLLSNQAESKGEQ